MIDGVFQNHGTTTEDDRVMLREHDAILDGHLGNTKTG